MAGKQTLALLLIFGFSFAIAKNWRKVLVFLGALAMTAVCFGVYTIVESVHSDLDPRIVAPTDVKAGLPDSAQPSTSQEG
ncbi:hypothetical protein [Kribbella sp. HUAS MG21]|jgi:hypothetical protein|uniref:Uncharacterized protein n=1 Tax=Kribbella sp. HUAS MG21 TaxID=3160966 RepID=A0AAU7TB46_9ACTN